MEALKTNSTSSPTFTFLVGVSATRVAGSIICACTINETEKKRNKKLNRMAILSKLGAKVTNGQPKKLNPLDKRTTGAIKLRLQSVFLRDHRSFPVHESI